ncbi:amino acid adenylation domain-containing protein [Paenibacillus arenosi]|uniref:Amino acid adenylation domain-containing protein n=1 Tax=Paenibacillus arenosi TaxID=2774142 RepID=A0ABR9AWT0_9BACL|nr:amino acid adenylation domain-containing protein [Paenibacillus arenosi]MBD8498539.1 amino acid adenylation domain-containing protein [Paenibacillus arenosi]
MNYMLFFKKYFLDCFKSEVAYQLLKHGYEIDDLFYNCYENTAKVYNETMVLNKGYWLYNVDSFTKEDLMDIGIKLIEQPISSHQEAANFLRTNVENGNIIFLPVRPKYFSDLQTMGPDDVHIVMIEEYCENTKSFKLTDVANFKDKWFESEYILDVIGKMSYEMFALDFKHVTVTSEIKHKFMNQAKRLIEELNDDYVLYVKCIEYIRSLNLKSVAEVKRTVFHLRQAFTIICGSRYVFSKYLSKNNVKHSLCELVLHCSDLAENIRNLLTEKELELRSGKTVVLFDDVEELCIQLYEYEKLTLLLLKDEWIDEQQLELRSVYRNAAENPKQIEVLDLNSHSILISWQPPALSEYIVSYEITVNSEQYHSKESKYRIVNLEPEVSYKVVVKAIDAFGNISVPGIELLLTTSSLQPSEDLALFKRVSASSWEENNVDEHFQPHNVVDGTEMSRWSSKFEEPQWICIDLGAIYDINKVVLHWEAAHAVAYQLQVSMNNVDWENIYSTSTGQGGEEAIHCEGRGRYFRLDCLKRMTKWGYSLYKINIFGDDFLASDCSDKQIEENSQKNTHYFKDTTDHTFNNTTTVYPSDDHIGILFEEQVLKTPHQVALRFEETVLTYSQLNERANQVARKLQHKGVAIGTKVGIMASHSLEMVIGILAIIKAGAAYVPIDASYPVERINYMVADSAVQIILTNDANIAENDYAFSGKYVLLTNADLYTGESANLELTISPNDLVYMIYTSGSTGLPKGVMIEHRGLVNYIWWAKQQYVKHDHEVFALYSSISFDLTVTSIFTPLICGAQIDIYREEGAEFALFKVVRDNRATVIKLTPSHLSLLKDINITSSSVQTFIVGGEDLKCSLAASIVKHFGSHVHLYNEYGPTETVVGCMIYLFNVDLDKEVSVPIGVPADNVQIYILDQSLEIVPIGTVGELYIAGDGVARGYLNQEQLTEQRFISNPYLPGARMYRTGDLAKYRADGQIEYLGRADTQVKIRGFRIEMGEIEERLLSMEGIKEAVVASKEDVKGGAVLCAYFTADNEINTQDIKQYLSIYLPSYMIPNYIERMDKIPLTVNGKVNISQLPEPTQMVQTQVQFVMYRNQKEKILIETMQEVLQISKISMKDDFFDIGGDSIKAIKLADKLTYLGLTISVMDILSFSVIEEMAEYVVMNDLSSLSMSSRPF